MALTLCQTDQLTKLLFTKAHALCIDTNSFTKSPQHLDVVMGFNTSDMIWWEPITQKYARLNKNVRLLYVVGQAYKSHFNHRAQSIPHQFRT